MEETIDGGPYVIREIARSRLRNFSHIIKKTLRVRFFQRIPEIFLGICKIVEFAASMSAALLNLEKMGRQQGESTAPQIVMPFFVM